MGRVAISNGGSVSEVRRTGFAREMWNQHVGLFWHHLSQYILNFLASCQCCPSNSQPGYPCPCVVDFWLAAKYDVSFQVFLIHYTPQSLNLGSMAIFWRFVCGNSVPYVGRRANRLVKSWRINKRMYYTAALYCKGPCRTQTKCLHGPNPELRSLSISELVWGL